MFDIIHYFAPTFSPRLIPDLSIEEAIKELRAITPTAYRLEVHLQGCGRYWLHWDYRIGQYEVIQRHNGRCMTLGRSCVRPAAALTRLAKLAGKGDA